jgi:hypothetical protein
LHEHKNEPSASVHVACASQLSDPRLHSKTFAHATPLPVHPALHAHVKLPVVSVHVASGAQLSVPSAHSLTVAHAVPLPV